MDPKHVPLRLTERERVILGTVEGALDHSEYTANIDVSRSMSYVSESFDKESRITKEVNEVSRVLIALSVANDFRNKGGHEMLSRTIRENGEFLRSCLEIGRRYKIMNPDKMRDTYGKLLYMLMDAAMPGWVVVVVFVGVKLVQSIKTPRRTR